MTTIQVLACICVGLVFVLWILNELVKSQKSKESMPETSTKMKMVVSFNEPYPGNISLTNHRADSVSMLQQKLNLYHFASIKRACVIYDGRITHVMNQAGVLEAV